MAVLVAGIVIAAAAAGGCPLVAVKLRRWAETVEGTGGERVELVHRLRVAQARLGLGAVVAGFALMSACWAGLEAHRSGPQAAGWGLVGLAGATVFLGFPPAGRRAIRPSYARLRDIDTRVERRGRRIALAAASILVYGAVFAAGIAVAPATGTGRTVGAVLAYTAALFVVNAALAPLVPPAMGAEGLPPVVHARLMSLSLRMGGRVRDIRSFPARNKRTANAVQVGVLPGLRYILVSDYLLDHMTDEEVDAVVAHELGHARGNHVAVRLLSVACCWAALVAAASFVTRSPADPALLVAVLVTSYLVAVTAVRGAVGIRQERRADIVAASCVGAAPLAAALGKLADLNHVRRSTGWRWNLLTQHPGIEQRLAVLAPATAAAAAPPAPGGTGFS